MNIRIFLPLISFVMLVSDTTFAQYDSSPIIVNEIGVFPQSKDRYIELLVLGDTNQPANVPVDLSGWSIDNLSSADPADMGYISLGTAFTNVYPGSLILLYDPEHLHGKIDPANNGLPNDDGVYQVPFDSPHLIKHATNSVGDVNGTFSWDKSLGWASSADAIIVRDPSQTPQHAISWAGAAFEERNGYSTVNIARPLPPQITTIALQNPCSIFGEGFLNGEDHQLGILASPGRYNSIENGIWINDISAQGASIVQLTMSCDEGIPALSDGTLGSLTVYISGGRPPYTITWNGPESGQITSPTAGAQVLTSLPAGTYTIVLTDAQNCQSYCQSAVRTLDNEKPVCAGACTEIGVTAQAGYCYSWEPSDDLTTPHPSEWSPCPEETTRYKLTIATEEGDIVEEKFYEIEVVELEVEIMPDPAILCGNTPVLLNAESYVTGLSYEWSSGELSSFISKNQLGNYAVTVTDENGCTASDESVILAPDDCEGISSWFEENRFNSVVVSAYEPSALRNSSASDRSMSSCSINDYADLTVTIEGESYDLEEVMCQDVQVSGTGLEVYITSNSAENMCGSTSENSTFREVQEIWEEMPYRFMVWAHVCQHPDGTATLYWSQKLQAALEETFSDDCQQTLLNTITNEWIRKAFAYGEGLIGNNVKICTWYEAIKAGDDSGVYRSVIGKIGEGLVAEELYTNFSIFDGIAIDIVPGGYEWVRFGSSTKHIDIGAYFFLYRPPWPFGPNPGVSGIRVPYSDKDTGNDALADFRLIDPNSILPTPQMGVLEAVIEVKTYANANQGLPLINEGIGQLSSSISNSVLPNIGILVIPRERWLDFPNSQRPTINTAIGEMEAWKVSLPFYNYDQQQGYFLLSSGLRSRAEGAYIVIKQALAAINCNCE